MQKKINHIKLFAENGKDLETLIQIYSEDIGMEFRIEKRTIPIMKNGKWHMMEGIELPNQDKIRMFEEKETYKYVGSGHHQTCREERKN